MYITNLGFKLNRKLFIYMYMKMGLIRPHYFYNILLLIIFSICIYLLTSQTLGQSETGQPLIRTSITSERRTNPKYSIVISSSSSNSNLSSSSLEDIIKPDMLENKFEDFLVERSAGSQTKDWFQIFQETAHKVYQMLSPDYLNKFREWSVGKEREFLTEEMSNYKFGGKFKKLSDLVLEKGGKPIRNVIFSTWRSGSTFLGEVLDNHPGTYYHYEPLLHFEIVQVRSGGLAQEGLRVIRNLLNCRYNNLTEYLRYGEEHHWLYNHNSRVWQFCEKNHEVCWDPDFLTRMCRLFPFQSLKTVRMRLKLAKPLLDDKELDIRLLLLIRDPRGTLQSRQHREWCPGNPDCEAPHSLCSDLEADFNIAKKLRTEYPGRFMALRYEDISSNPYSAIKKLFSFFRLEYHPKVESYLDHHTISNVGGVSSTFRDSKAAPFHWRKDLLNNFDEVKRIQLQCKKAMGLWGYRLAKDKFDMMTFNPMLKPPWKEMIVSKDVEKVVVDKGKGI